MKRLLCSLALLGLACAPTQPATSADGGALHADYSAWKGVVRDDTVKLLEQYQLGAQGEAADLDGNGKVDLVVLRRADGTRVSRYEPDGDWAPAWVREEFPDGSTRLSIDTNGRPGFEVTIDTDAQGLERTIEDADQDGVADQRSARTPVADGWEVVDEQGSDATGWTEVARYLMPRQLGQQGGKCNSFANWGQTGPVDVRTLFGYPLVHVLSEQGGDSPAAACTPERTKRLMRAFECGMDRIKCLDRANKNFAAQLRAVMLSVPLFIGCGNPCAGQYAGTHVMDTKRARMAWNADELDKMTDSQACSTALHEMLHWAQGKTGEAHDDGTDKVYACGNYCGGCEQLGPRMPPRTASENCAKCAETPEEMARCGFKEKVQPMPCPTDAFCHGSIGTNAACATCQGKQRFDCLNFPMSKTKDFLCCQTCPADANRANDRQCDAAPMLVDSCNDKPPECP